MTEHLNHGIDEHDLLIRIDERTRSISEQMISYEDRLAKIKTTHITREEFDPVKKIAYALVGVASLAVVAAVVKLVVVG